MENITEARKEETQPAAIGEESQSLTTLLMEQRAHNKKMQQLMKITAGCMLGILAVAVLAAALILPKAMGILSGADAVIAQVQEIAGQAEEVMADAKDVVAQIKAGDPKTVMDQVKSLATEGETAMQDCVEQVKRAVDILDKMDIDSLNTAVDNLGKAIAPLAKLFGGK